MAPTERWWGDVGEPGRRILCYLWHISWVYLWATAGDTTRSRTYPMLYVKNMPLALWPHTYPRFILAYALILGNAIVHGRGMPAVRGWVKSWLLIPHMFGERFKIQKAKKVSAKYIDSIILHDIPPEQTGLRKFRDAFTRKR